jgi:Ran GTPase-activating protein (RanGAP) involved in mRNA processing and transport
VPSLKEIRISSNMIGDEGGALLGLGLLENKTIKVCHASNNKLSAETSKSMAKVLE